MSYRGGSHPRGAARGGRFGWDRNSNRGGHGGGKSKNPEGWDHCKEHGTVIDNSSILALKVPLHWSAWNPKAAVAKIEGENSPKRVGLIVDLTATDRYYGAKAIHDLGIKYEKILVPGREMVPRHLVDRFCKVMLDFETTKPDEVALVHCTHGHNRTGFMIISYLMERHTMDSSFSPTSLDEALSSFREARPPGMYDHEMLEFLYNKYDPEATIERVYPPLPPWKQKKLGSGAAHQHGGPKEGETKAPADVESKQEETTESATSEVQRDHDVEEDKVPKKKKKATAPTPATNETLDHHPADQPKPKKKKKAAAPTQPVENGSVPQADSSNSHKKKKKANAAEPTESVDRSEEDALDRIAEQAKPKKKKRAAPAVEDDVVQTEAPEEHESKPKKKKKAATATTLPNGEHDAEQLNQNSETAPQVKPSKKCQTSAEPPIAKKKTKRTRTPSPASPAHSPVAAPTPLPKAKEQSQKKNSPSLSEPKPSVKSADKGSSTSHQKLATPASKPEQKKRKLDSSEDQSPRLTPAPAPAKKPLKALPPPLPQSDSEDEFQTTSVTASIKAAPKTTPKPISKPTPSQPKSKTLVQKQQEESDSDDEGPLSRAKKAMKSKK